MKKQVLSFAFALCAIAANAQTQSMGIGTVNPNPSAVLDVFGSDKGLLIPRVTLQSVTDATTIPTPATSLIVYNTNASMPAGTGYYFNAGSPANPRWQHLAAVDGGTAPVPGNTIIWNGTTYVPGNETIYTTGTPLGGAGTSVNPLTINTAVAVYNANNIQGKPVSTVAPSTGQVLVWNGTQYVPNTVGNDNWGTQSIMLNPSTQLSGNGTTASPLQFTGVVTGSQIGGNGTLLSPLTFNGVVTTGTAISGNGTLTTPLTINNGVPIYNANKIASTNVSSATPTAGQTLVFDGTNYVPTTPIVTTSGPAITGDGTPSNPLIVKNGDALFNANKINGTNVTGTPTANGQVLVYNSLSGSYEPGTAPGDNWGTQVAATTGAAIGGNGSAGSPLTVNNNAPIFNAAAIQGKSVTSVAPTAGQTLVFDGTSYVPTTPAATTSGPAVTGNGTSLSPITVNNTLPLFNANSLQGKAISSTAPTTNQVLQYNGTSYAPATLADTWGTQSAVVNATTLTGNGTAASPLAANNTSNIWNANKINNISVTGAPTTGQTLIFDGTNYVPTTAPDTWGTQTAAVNTTTMTGNGTAGSPLAANNTANIWNAGSINGKVVDFTIAPTTGQTLIYNSTTNKFVPGTTADNWGTQTAATTGAAISGNGSAASPLAVNNTAAIFNANQINSTSVTGTPTTNQVLQFNGTSYAPATLTDTWGTQSAAVSATTLTGNGTAGSPLAANNTSNIWNANKINNIGVTGVPTTGQTLIYDGTNYVPTTAPDTWGTQTAAVNATTLTGNGTAGSPLAANNTANIWNAGSINGKVVDFSVAPTTGQTLVYNSTTNKFVPGTTADNWGTQTAATTGAAISGNGSVASPLAVNNTAAIFNANQINSTSVTGTPTTNQVLQFNGTSYAPTTLTDTWGTQTASVNSTTMSGNGTSGSPLTANNTSNIWNANQINGKTVNFTVAPTNGQTLVYNSTTNTFVPGAAAGDNWGTQTASVNATTMSGNGSSGSPLTANNTSNIWNASKINNITISGTPTTGQTLVYDGTNYVFTNNDNTTASNGLVMSGNDVRLGGALTSSTTIPMGANSLTLTQTTGAVNITSTTATQALNVTSTADPLKLTGLQAIASTATYKNLVVDANGVVKTNTFNDKVLAAYCNGDQQMDATSFNNGNAQKLTFIPSDIIVNTGGLYSFNDATDEFTVNEAGAYEIQGYSGYVSNDDASNGSSGTNSNIINAADWGQGINLTINVNGTIKDGTRFIYTKDMGHTTVSSGVGVNFIATIETKTILNLAAGDKITISLQKVLGNSSVDPHIVVPTGLTQSKKIMIKRL